MKNKNNLKGVLKDNLNICILGPSGYTGHETIRILLRHPKVKIKLLIGNKSSGKNVNEIFSTLINIDLPKIISIKDADFKGIDVVFSCMPSGQLCSIIDFLPRDLVLIDLSADFRIKDYKLYEKYYGTHKNKNFLKKFAYGLPEINKKKILKSKYISCPGCYPTSILIPLLPLLKENIINMKDIIVDSKSGITGAGKNLKPELLFSENYSSLKAYGQGKHRHIPEIEHQITQFTRKKTNIIFTPHLIPINRGILSTIYIKGNISKIENCLKKNYMSNKFIQLNPLGEPPKLSDVLGSNNCKIGLIKHQTKDFVILISVIDNLVKGASGQAIQNMNLVFNFPEEIGLDQLSFWP